jgi:dCMP deaminase
MNDIEFLGLAEYVSRWSKDPSTKVGAVIVRPDRSICSVGFNGFPQNMPDSPELYNNREEKYSRVVHGEINAKEFAVDKVKGYTLYTTPFLPCDRCFVQMVQAGIIRFVAPKATEDQLTRWGPSFEKVRKYAKECKVELIEMDYASILPNLPPMRIQNSTLTTLDESEHNMLGCCSADCL